MNTKWAWVIARLSENSTWRGLITLATAFGVTVRPEDGEKIIAFGLALVGLINIFRTAPPSAQAVAIAVNTGNTEHLVKTPAETETPKP